jgi:hypothetical protein
MRTILKKAALVSGVVLTTTGFAQTNTTPAAAPATKVAAMTTAAPAAATAGSWTALNIEQLKTTLTLKPEQVTKITDLNSSFNKRYEMLKKDEATIGAQAFPGRVSALMQERNKQVRALLDAQQQKKWDALYPAPTAATTAKPAAPAKKETH